MIFKGDLSHCFVKFFTDQTGICLDLKKYFGQACVLRPNARAMILKRCSSLYFSDLRPLHANQSAGACFAQKFGRHSSPRRHMSRLCIQHQRSLRTTLSGFLLAPRLKSISLERFWLAPSLKSTASQVFVFTTIFSPENRSTFAGQLL